MADAPDPNEILNEQAALQLMMEDLPNIEDPEQHEQALAMVQEQAARLEEMAESFGADMESFYEEELEEMEDDGDSDGAGRGSAAVVEVVLKPDQRARVKEETGVDVPTVKIPDPTGQRTEYMQETTPEEIEEAAILRANLFNEMVANYEALMETVAELRAEAEKIPDPEVRAEFEAKIEELVAEAQPKL